ncbi:hypothetical protein [Thermobifida halotolerans]|nr:hypothetical protein [Thermobifida halotolerans]
MARRIDHLNDPNAPEATGIVPPVNVAVRDGAAAADPPQRQR